METGGRGGRGLARTGAAPGASETSGLVKRAEEHRGAPLETRVRRRLTAARQRLADGERLGETLAGSESDSGYLLKVLGFELLLKTVLLINAGRDGREEGHDYASIFSALPDDVRDRIVRAAKERMTPDEDYSDVPGLLTAFGRNFVRLRYAFEKYDDLTDEECRAIGEEWIAAGASEKNADFTYYPEELHGLIHALEAEVKQWLESAAS